MIAPTGRGLLWGTLGMLGFSATLPFTRMALTSLDATVVSLGRALVAAACAALVLRVRGAEVPARRHWPGLYVVAGGVVIGFPLLITLALREMPASHGAVIVGLLPAATSVCTALRGHERPSPAFWIASAAGLLGVLVFAATRGATGLHRADALALLAVTAAAFGYSEGGHLARSLGGWTVICWALVLAAPVLVLPVAFALQRTGFHVGLRSGLGFGYVSLISMFLGFFAFYRGMAEAGVARVSQLQLAQPILTVFWSALLVGERLQASTVAAALFVIGCVLFTLRSRVQRPAAVAGP